ncbi:acetyl/propionyl/methylcrotonyl-CoA carboxylase subunit alpha [Streptomyces sp. NPDC127068]|uniref:acetyl-CoA carboxylase biotin carboxylase subunit n=1 Tax=Streptomyces sp. NPDC127068 TaxID=3347127 RepID=UPI003664E2FC
MIRSLLVANRGEIARRVIRTAGRLGIRTVAVHSPHDAQLPFVREADEAVALAGNTPAESYGNADAVLAAARATGVEAVHPGYGFLSENADFAHRVLAAGLTWVGPSPEVIALMGDKRNARDQAVAVGVPVAPGTSEPLADEGAAVQAARTVGYPLMVKAAAGGGGMGMAVARDEVELRAQYRAVVAFASRLFGDPGVLLERYYHRARHIEVQILGGADGEVLALGERNCSVQRRHQKLVEESPSPALDAALRTRMLTAAVTLGRAVGYRGAGTVECLVHGPPGQQDFVFLEMNTRLQVEHPVTEAVFGVDLVEEQLRAASGLAPTPGLGSRTPVGHAIEFRVNAEDPVRFLPGPGRVTRWREPVGEGIRVDAGYAEGDTVTPAYDSLMAKLVVHAGTRAEALAVAAGALAEFVVVGPRSTLPFHQDLLGRSEFARGTYDTGIVTQMRAGDPRR